MVYNEFHGKQLSALGLGCMRLPHGPKDDADIDVAQVREMIACAMKQGINYYDTAWGYHNGNSETVIGEELSKYPRDSYYLATKFPVMTCQICRKSGAFLSSSLASAR